MVTGSNSGFSRYLVWYKNNKGQALFGEQQIIVLATAIARSVFAIDLD